MVSLEEAGGLRCLEILGPPKVEAVSVGMGIMPELPAWHWCLGEGLAQRVAGKTLDCDSTWQEVMS